MIELLFISILSAPTIYELLEDRNGDVHPNNDIVGRGIFMVLVSAIVVGLRYVFKIESGFSYITAFFQALAMSLGIFIFFFPYAINLVHRKKRWWDSLSKTAWPDRLEWWRLTPWPARMFFQLLALVVAASLYFCLGKVIDFDCVCSGSTLSANIN